MFFFAPEGRFSPAMPHIVMQAPANSGSQYYNYKGSHSIVLLAVCDANYCFTLLDLGKYGRQSDGGVFSNSLLGTAMEAIPCLFLSLMLSQVYLHLFHTFLLLILLSPWRRTLWNINPGSYLPEKKRIFNYRLFRARCVIENTFGILATKFRIFRRPIIAEPEK